MSGRGGGARRLALSQGESLSFDHEIINAPVVDSYNDGSRVSFGECANGLCLGAMALRGQSGG